MSVIVRPYVTGGWEVDIRIVLPDGTVLRERRKAQQQSELSARRCGKPKTIRKEEQPKTPTVREFASRFVDGYAKANRLKPSGIAAKDTILRVHLIPRLGDTRLDHDRRRAAAEVGARSALTGRRSTTY